MESNKPTPEEIKEAIRNSYCKETGSNFQHNPYQYLAYLESKIVEHREALPTHSKEEVERMAEAYVRSIYGYRSFSREEDGKSWDTAGQKLFEAFISGFTSKALLKEQDWISVDDRLPEMNTDVLCYSEKEQEKFFIDYLFKGADKVYWDFGTDPKTGENTVTHWRPLPSPPKSKD